MAHEFDSCEDDWSVTLEKVPQFEFVQCFSRDWDKVIPVCLFYLLIKYLFWSIIEKRSWPSLYHDFMDVIPQDKAVIRI